MVKTRGSLAKTSISDEEEIAIWKFIHGRIREAQKNETTISVSVDLWKKYIDKTFTDFTIQELHEHYLNVMVPDLYKTALPRMKILELYKELKIPISGHIKDMLETGCQVSISLKEGCVDTYAFHGTSEVSVEKEYENMGAESPASSNEPDSSDTAEMSHIEIMNNTIKYLPDDLYVSEDLKIAMWNYVKKSCKNRVPTDLLTLEYWEVFARNEKLRMFSPDMLRKFFHSMIGNFWKLDIDVNVKLATMRSFMIEVYPDQLKWFSENYSCDIELRDGKFINKWSFNTSNENTCSSTNGLTRKKSQIDVWSPKNSAAGGNDAGSCTSSGPLQDHVSHCAEWKPEMNLGFGKNTRSAFSDKENIAIWDFLWRKIYDHEKKKFTNVQVMPKGIAIWREFLEESKLNRSPANLASHYRKVMQSMLLRQGFTAFKCLNLYKIFDIPVDSQLANRIEEMYGVKLRVDGLRITGWEFVDSNDDVENAVQNANNGMLEEENSSEAARRDMSNIKHRKRKFMEDESAPDTRKRGIKENESITEKGNSLNTAFIEVVSSSCEIVDSSQCAEVPSECKDSQNDEELFGSSRQEETAPELNNASEITEDIHKANNIVQSIVDLEFSQETQNQEADLEGEGEKEKEQSVPDRQNDNLSDSRVECENEGELESNAEVDEFTDATIGSSLVIESCVTVDLLSNNPDVESVPREFEESEGEKNSGPENCPLEDDQQEYDSIFFETQCVGGAENEICSDLVEGRQREEGETNVETLVDEEYEIEEDLSEETTDSREETPDIDIPFSEIVELISSAEDLSESTKTELLQKCVSLINSTDNLSLEVLKCAVKECFEQVSSDIPISDEEFEKMCMEMREKIKSELGKIPEIYNDRLEAVLKNIMEECRKMSWDKESFYCFVSMYKEHLTTTVNSWSV